EKNLVIVAEVKDELYIRIFNAAGEKVFDARESNPRNKAQARQVTKLKSLFRDLPDPSKPSPTDKRRVIAAVTSIAGQVQEKKKNEGHGSAFEWLTGPLEGVNSARNWSMVFRNDEQIRMLSDLLNTSDRKKFDTFVFAHEGDAAMNWIIADKSI